MFKIKEGIDFLIGIDIVNTLQIPKIISKS